MTAFIREVEHLREETRRRQQPQEKEQCPTMTHGASTRGSKLPLSPTTMATDNHTSKRPHTEDDWFSIRDFEAYSEGVLMRGEDATMSERIRKGLEELPPFPTGHSYHRIDLGSEDTASAETLRPLLSDFPSSTSLARGENTTTTEGLTPLLSDFLSGDLPAPAKTPTTAKSLFRPTPQFPTTHLPALRGSPDRKWDRLGRMGLSPGNHTSDTYVRFLTKKCNIARQAQYLEMMRDQVGAAWHIRYPVGVRPGLDLENFNLGVKRREKVENRGRCSRKDLDALGMKMLLRESQTFTEGTYFSAQFDERKKEMRQRGSQYIDLFSSGLKNAGRDPSELREILTQIEKLKKRVRKSQLHELQDLMCTDDDFDQVLKHSLFVRDDKEKEARKRKQGTYKAYGKMYQKFKLNLHAADDRREEFYKVCRKVAKESNSQIDSEWAKNQQAKDSDDKREKDEDKLQTLTRQSATYLIKRMLVDEGMTVSLTGSPTFKSSSGPNPHSVEFTGGCVENPDFAENLEFDIRTVQQCIAAGTQEFVPVKEKADSFTHIIFKNQLWDNPSDILDLDVREKRIGKKEVKKAEELTWLIYKGNRVRALDAINEIQEEEEERLRKIRRWEGRIGSRMAEIGAPKHVVRQLGPAKASRSILDGDEGYGSGRERDEIVEDEPVPKDLVVSENTADR